MAEQFLQAPMPTEPQGQNNLTIPLNQPTPKLKIFLMLGGALVLIGLLLFLVLSPGGEQGGAVSLRAAGKSIGQSVVILDKYAEKSKGTGIKNDTALMLILLRGTLQRTADLDKETYNSKTRISSTPKLDEEDQSGLDQAERQNLLDDEIIKALKSKITNAQKNLRQAKTEVKEKKTIDAISDLQADLDSVDLVLNKVR